MLFRSDLDDYARWLQLQRSEAKAQAAPLKTGVGESSAQSKKERRQQEAEQRKRLQPLNNKIKKLERQLEQQSLALEKVEAELADPEIYQDEAKERLREQLSHQATLKSQGEQTELEWLAACEALEQAEQ